MNCLELFIFSNRSTLFSSRRMGFLQALQVVFFFAHIGRMIFVGTNRVS